MDFKKIKKLAEAQQDYMVEMRRYFHTHAEVSDHEFGRCKVLQRELDSLNIPYELLEGTGIIATIQGGKPGKHRLLRCDIDALPLQEEKENLSGAKVCVSENDGACHACGHDAHMAMMLGTARVLAQVKDELEGTVYCCFEEGEESNGGIATMMKALEKYTVDECFALHVYNALEVGKISMVAGPRMAGAVRFDMTFHGRAGHGSRPDLSINPIVPAAHMVGELDSALRNQLNAESIATLGLCTFRAGDTWNIIPETAFLSGSARYFDKEAGPQVLDLIKKSAEATASIHRCTVTYEPTTKVILEPVINDPAVAARVSDGLAEMCGADVLDQDCGRWYASETFSRYMEKCPGALGLLGIKNEKLGSGAPHHNGKFDLDEHAMVLGACSELVFALKN